ncbi:uncharacterized protein LOC123447587 [Hordeum vulgare subsp. vulgare]|nr:uncharacterized protein LOC123447587 [Hordeum vulgare subsp. vulgare]
MLLRLWAGVRYTAPDRPGIMAMEPTEDIEFLWKWRKYLLLLATLVASVTYGAGLNPPGGVWSDDQKGGSSSNARQHRVEPPAPLLPAAPAPAVYPFRVGDPVLVSTYSRRYTAFFYCNAAAFVASLVTIMFLLDRRISGNRVGLTVLRSAMLLDLLALMAAFAAGSCRSISGSIYVSALFVVVFAYVALHLVVASASSRSCLGLFACGETSCLVLFRRKAPAAGADAEEDKYVKERRKFLLLLATFATPLTYAAGLTPPGGFWSKNRDEHRAGAPLLHDGRYKIRYHAFFYANANSFVASLAIIMLLMSRTLSGRLARSNALLVCVLVELLGLMAAYAAGSCRWLTTTVYIVCLVGVVFLYIVLQVVIAGYTMGTFKQWGQAICRLLTCANLQDPKESKPATLSDTQPGNANAPQKDVASRINNDNGQEDKVEESRSLVLLLATLAATVTYQAGLSPPGGVWPAGDPPRTAGDPVLHIMHRKRYLAFYHCNTAAFVASVVVIIIVQSKQLTAVGRAALKTAMILDLFGLMGAYVAGSCRDNTTTIYVSALAVAVFAYAVAKVMAYTAQGKHSWATRKARGARDKLARLLHLTSDAASSSQHRQQGEAQGWEQVPAAGVGHLRGESSGKGGEEAQPQRHQDVAGSKVPGASGHNRGQGMESSWLARWAQSMCDKLARFLHLTSDKTPQQEAQGSPSGILPYDQHQNQPSSESERKRILVEEKKNFERKRKFLLQLAILAATVTYQTGLNPPGGFWTENNGDKLVTPGDPILLDHYGVRYQVFFYCNATGFMASVTVILLLMNQTLSKSGIRSKALHVCIMMGLLGLMGAYAAGSCRLLRTSIYVFALVAAVVAFLVLEILFYVYANRRNLSQQPWVPQWLQTLLKPLSSAPMRSADEDEDTEVLASGSERLQQQQRRRRKNYTKRKSLMLLGILAASVTYQAGLAPPGGTWGDDDVPSPSPSQSQLLPPSPSGAYLPHAGNPILLNTNPERYQAFYYCNATSFVASIVVILLVLQHTVKEKKHSAPLWAMQTAVVLDLFGLLGAYAAGSCRDWETSAYVIALVALVVVFITIYVLVSLALLAKAKELKVWKFFSGKKAKVLKYFG